MQDYAKKTTRSTFTNFSEKVEKRATEETARFQW